MLGECEKKFPTSNYQKFCGLVFQKRGNNICFDVTQEQQTKKQLAEMEKSQKQAIAKCSGMAKQLKGADKKMSDLRKDNERCAYEPFMKYHVSLKFSNFFFSNFF